MTTSPPVGSSAAKEAADEAIINSIGAYEYGWHDSDAAGSVAKRGLDADVVRYISKAKNEPEWMLKRRLKAYKTFERKPIPTWGPDLSNLDMDQIK